MNNRCTPPSAHPGRRHLLAIVLALACSPVLAQETSRKPTTLDAVVVSAAGFAQMVREAPASITVITREELDLKPIHNLADALADVEGVDVGVGLDKTGAPQISLRGMPSGYTLILIDGRRQNTSGNVAPNDFGNTANNFIPPVSAIERIEVIRGPMSTLYGSDAMGGVVNIITRKTGKHWQGSATVETTAQQHDAHGNQHGANVYLSGPLAGEQLGLSVYGGRFNRRAAHIVYTDIHGDDITPWMSGNPVAYDNHHIGSRLSWSPTSRHDLWLEAVASRQKYDNGDGQMGTLGSGGYAKTLRFNRDQALLAWDARFTNASLETSLLHSETKTIGRLLPAGTAGAGSPRQLNNRNQVLDSKLVTGFGPHTLTVGGQYWRARLVDGATPAPFNFTQWALFAEDEWQLHDAVNLTLGARHDNHSTFGSQLSPRAYLVWNADPHWVVKGGYSAGYKTPNVEDLSPGIKGFGGQGTIPLIGSPNLTPETSGTTELGVYFANDAGLSANLTLFHNAFDNKIAAGTPVANCAYGLTAEQYAAGGFTDASCVDVGYFPRAATLGRSVNIDKATTHGAELAMRMRLSPAVNMGWNYTHTRSEQKSGAAKGAPLTNTPRHLLNAHLDWQATAAVNLYLRGEYRSSRYRGAGDAQDQLGDYKPYSQFHLGGRYQINPKISLNAAVHNLFDKNFVDYLAYTHAGLPAYANSRSTSEAGRRLWLSMNVDF